MSKLDSMMKCAQARSLVNEGNYEQALEIVEGIHIESVKSITDLKIIADVYMRTGQYEDAREIYFQLYDRIQTRSVLYYMIYLSVKCGLNEEAEDFYKEYQEKDKDSVDRLILNYYIEKAKGADSAKKIACLQKICEEEYIEEWAYELAKMYHKAGMEEECVDECSKIILWYGDGVIVEKAMLLKLHYVDGLDISTPKAIAETRNIAADLKMAAMIADRNDARKRKAAARRKEMEERAKVRNITELRPIPEPTEQETAGPEPNSRPAEKNTEEKKPIPQPVVQNTGEEEPAPEPAVLDTEEESALRPIRLDSEEKKPIPQPIVQNMEKEEQSALFKETKRMPVTHLEAETKLPETREAKQAEPRQDRIKPAERTLEEIKLAGDNTAEVRLPGQQADTERKSSEKRSSKSSGNTENIIIEIVREAAEEKRRPHFSIVGRDQAKIKETAKMLASSMCEEGLLPSPRLARITSEKLNEIHLEDKQDTIDGSCLLIEDAHNLSLDSIRDIYQLIRRLKGRITIILADEEEPMKKLLDKNRKLSKLITYELTV